MRASILLSILLSVVVQAQEQWYDSGSEMAFALTSAANGSSTDLYFTLSAPEKAGWGAVGIGGGMGGALMFLIYPGMATDSVTVSVRTASGNNEPYEIDGIDYQVVKSGIQDGNMTASIICYSCQSWKGGDLNPNSTQQPWIWAVGPHSNTQSDSMSVYLPQHSSMGSFDVNMTDSQSYHPEVPVLTYSTSKFINSEPADFTGLLTAHAVLLGVPFVFLFPLGVVALRLPIRFAGFNMHWSIQLGCVISMIVGFALALTFSRQSSDYAHISMGHQVFGIIIVVVTLLFQPALGYVHHLLYVKHKRRTIPSWVHIMLGRIVIWCGMVNTCLGFHLADEHAKTIAAGVVSAVIAVALELGLIYIARSKKKDPVAPGLWAPLEVESAKHDPMLGSPQPSESEDLSKENPAVELAPLRSQDLMSPQMSRME